MGVFVYNCYDIILLFYDIILLLFSDMISATRLLRSLVADITSSLMDKNHIQIHP